MAYRRTYEDFIKNTNVQTLVLNPNQQYEVQNVVYVSLVLLSSITCHTEVLDLYIYLSQNSKFSPQHCS